MPPEKTHYITRDYIIEHAATHIFIYSDNYYQVGIGQQASVARGMANAFGIPTSLSYPATDGSSNANHLFSDKYLDTNVKIIEKAFNAIPLKIPCIIFPKIGLGYADMPNKCPKTYAYLERKLNELKEMYAN